MMKVDIALRGLFNLLIILIIILVIRQWRKVHRKPESLLTRDLLLKSENVEPGDVHELLDEMGNEILRDGKEVEPPHEVTPVVQDNKLETEKTDARVVEADPETSAPENDEEKGHEIRPDIFKGQGQTVDINTDTNKHDAEIDDRKDSLTVIDDKHDAVTAVEGNGAVTDVEGNVAVTDYVKVSVKGADKTHGTVTDILDIETGDDDRRAVTDGKTDTAKDPAERQDAVTDHKKASVKGVEDRHGSLINDNKDSVRSVDDDRLGAVPDIKQHSKGEDASYKMGEKITAKAEKSKTKEIGVKYDSMKNEKQAEKKIKDSGEKRQENNDIRAHPDTMKIKPMVANKANAETKDIKDKKDNIVNGNSAAHNQSMYSCEVGSECWKFNNLLKENWDRSKPKAAIYILTRACDLPELLKTLRYLERNFIKRYRYPVVIFHEEDFIGNISIVRRSTGADIFFQEVQLEAPKWLHPSAPHSVECGGANMGYRNMCRFFSKIVYNLPIMRRLVYFMRLDAHSFITKPVPYDLFLNMKRKGYKYAYPCLTWEYRPCTHHLFDSAKQYIASKGIQPYFFDKLRGPKMFYNNFEMGDMSFFTGSAYQNYINYIDLLGGIYYYRWGDAPIKSIAVSIFIPENQTQHIYDIEYVHKTRKLTTGYSVNPLSLGCGKEQVHLD